MSEIPPNILLIMFDQLAPQFLPCYGHAVVKAPNIQRVAEAGVLFENAYCNSPLCAPSRFSMLSGRYCSRIGAYDNASEFPAQVPTLAHYLRSMDYRTCLAGKMHFIGADQLHGYERRLTTDVYPGDFGWTPDWENTAARPFWYHNMLSVVEAGVYERTLELDFDEEVAHQSLREIYDMARDSDERPFFLTVSFIQPHDPYMTPASYWNRYRETDIDLPRVPAPPYEERDPHAQRLYALCDMDAYRIAESQTRNARHAYFGMIAWLDDQVGRLLDALERGGQKERTVVILTSDHGDMLGERGLWYKMCFYEHAVRVPMIIQGPDVPRGLRVNENVSLVDLLPTVLDLAANGSNDGRAAPLDGHSLTPLMDGGGSPWADLVISEYLAEGTTQPMLMVKRGSHKFICCDGDPPQLFDLQNDPRELNNLAGANTHAEIEAAFASTANGHWNSETVRARVIASQHDRQVVQEALLNGAITPWDFQPLRDAAAQYNRNYGGEMYESDRRARIPYRDPPPPDA
jgi:choline-sulfatase